jgi:hypothetical protein
MGLGIIVNPSASLRINSAKNLVFRKRSEFRDSSSASGGLRMTKVVLA